MKRFFCWALALALAVTGAWTGAWAQSPAAFTLLGVPYSVYRLEDDPALAMPNQLDGLEGHLVAFSYPLSGQEAREANSMLYTTLRLIEPSGRKARAYANTDNLGNPYELYFGLEEGVALGDCVLSIQEDQGEKLFALSPAAEAAFLAAGTAFPQVEPSAPAEGAEESSFILAGIHYDLYRLEDKPALRLPNRMDGREGHVVRFAYRESAQTAQEANALLFTSARLIQPDGEQVEAYANEDNMGNPYALYFGLSDGVMLGDCVLSIQGDGGVRLIPLSADAPPADFPGRADSPGPTETPGPDPAQGGGEPEARLPADVSALWTAAVGDLLAELAQEETDPWRLAIYQGGAREVAWDGKALTFSLCAFDPSLSQLKKIPKDSEAYLKGLLENAASHSLAVTLKPQGEALGSKEKKALEKAVKQAATKARSDMGQKAVANALGRLLFPSPASPVKEAADLLAPSGDFEAWLASLAPAGLEELTGADWAPLFYAQAKHSLSTSGGPHALVLRCWGPSPETLLQEASADAYETFSRQARANESDLQTLREGLELALAERALAHRRKPQESFELTLDIDLLIQGESVPGHILYLGRYAFGDALEELQAQVSALPDYPALDFPKTGRLSGSTRGTKVVIKVPKDGSGRYVQLRLADTGEMVADAFLRSGGSCSLRAPRGDCYVLLAIGETWYGVEELFGEGGLYSRTEDFEVPSSNYYLTLTLGGAKNGNMSSYGSNPGAFHN